MTDIERAKYDVGLLEDGSLDCFPVGTNDQAVQRMIEKDKWYKDNQDEIYNQIMQTRAWEYKSSLKSVVNDSTIAMAKDYFGRDRSDKYMDDRYGKSWGGKMRRMLAHVRGFHRDHTFGYNSYNSKYKLNKYLTALMEARCKRAGTTIDKSKTKRDSDIKTLNTMIKNLRIELDTCHRDENTYIIKQLRAATRLIEAIEERRQLNYIDKL